MPQINTNPDRDFSADYRSEEKELRDLLKHGEVAVYDNAARQRVGALIGHSPNQYW